MIAPMLILLAYTVALSVHQWLSLRSPTAYRTHLVQVRAAETPAQRARALDAIAHGYAGSLSVLNWISGCAAYIGLVCTLIELLFGLQTVGHSNPAALLGTAIAALKATLVGLVTAIAASGAHAFLSRRLIDFGRRLEEGAE